jgi:hypothetical protein
MRANLMCDLIVQSALVDFAVMRVNRDREISAGWDDLFPRTFSQGSCWLGGFAAAWWLAAGDWLGALIQDGEVTLVDE